ncbi:MAG: peptide ABC transporter substrate-binding protein [Clostridiales bacterium]|nr:peptide ABC transporter substrate-binding protein [Clostridiales bacterium]
MKKNWTENTKHFFAVCMAALMLLCCACGEMESVAENSPSISMPTPALEPQPVSGGEVRMPMPTNAVVNDPLIVTSEEMLALFSLVYESLLSIDERGQLIPELAENWACDETGCVWTFKLRQQAKWHDTGASVKASDVAATYQRIVSLGTNTYYSFVTQRVQSMTAGADGSLVVTMKQPGLSSLYALTFPVVRGGILEESGLPVGTGAYHVTAVSDSTVRLHANTAWWKQVPYIESIMFYAKDSNDIALASFEAGQLDFVPTSSLSVGRYREEDVTNILDVMTQTAEVMLVNYANEELRNVSLRKAIACAIDRGHIITNVYMNRAQASDVPVAPDSWLYESKSKLYDYNAANALSLFAEAGWIDTDEDGYLEKDGTYDTELTLRLLVNDSTDSVRKSAAEMITQQLDAIGVHVELMTAGYALGDDASEYLSKIVKREFDLALIGFNLSRDCDLGPYIAAGGTKNFGGYSNAALEQLAKNVTTAADETAMREAASELEMRFAEELPFITLYFRLNSILYSADIRGVVGVREPDIMRTAEKWYLLSE